MFRYIKNHLTSYTFNDIFVIITTFIHEGVMSNLNSQSKPIFCSETMTTYPSINVVVAKFGIKREKVQFAISGKNRTVSGFHFEPYDSSIHPAPTLKV